MRSLHVLWAMGLFVARAHAWDPFLVENDEVQEGNARMAERDAPGALGHYDRAARALPSEPGVHLNRGIALLESGEIDRAREALLLATEPPASPEIRADAYYDLGIGFYRQGDEAAGGDDHREAQRLFREAADAFRRSLRIRPGNADAGWNLELALRRIREQEEQQEQQDQQQQDQQDQQQDQQDQQQDQQDQQQDQQDQQQDQQDQQQDQQDQQQQDQQDQQQDQQDQEQQGQQDQQQQDQQQQDQQQQDQQQPGDQENGGQQDQQEPPSGGTTERSLPPESAQVLDALRDSEENLERARARARATRENRRVEQDW